MKFHWQDLNERDETTGRRRKFGWHGRAWWGKWRFEWNVPTHFWHVHLSVNGGDGDDEVQVSFGCGLFAFWLSHAGHPFKRFGYLTTYQGCPLWLSTPREFNVSIHSGAVWFKVWGHPHDWQRSDPWWARGLCWHPLDTLLGRTRHTHRILEEWKDVLVPMPEGCYPVKMRREEREWKRPLWPWWPFRFLSEYIEIQIDGGIPFEGKGENSWDCGEDGLWGCSSSGTSYEKAIGHVVESVLDSRIRYGGRWTHRDLAPILAKPRGMKA